MAKFKPGDKVTWQHHNGSYSNEVIDYIVPPNGYAFRDGGIGAESEIRAGWVPESQTGRANMPPLNSRACNGVRSSNAAPSAQLKRAYDEWKKAAEKFKKWFGAGRRLSERIPAGADESRKMIDFSDLFFRETGRRPPNGYGEMTLEQMLASNSQTCVRSRNSVVAKALNACANAAYPKAIDLGVGNWEATLMPRYNMLILEKGDYRAKDYANIDGTIDEVKRKVARVAKGKDLSDAMSICSRAAQEMEKYLKAERGHGRKPANACGTARNANSMRFGYNVKAEIDDNGRCAIEISLTPNTKRTLEGRTWAICKRYASAVLNELRVKAQELESAIAWMDQNAK